VIRAWLRERPVLLFLLLPAAGACTAAPPPAPAPVMTVDTVGPCTVTHAAGAEQVAYDCRGSGQNRAAGFSVSIPAGWRVQVTDSLDVALVATDGDRAIRVVGGDQLPPPVTAQDTLNFWLTANELALRREPTLRDVADFRFVLDDDPARARRWVTDELMETPRLSALAARLSAEGEGRPVIRRESEVRTLAGQPAGYLDEVVGGESPWHTTGYMTFRDAVLYIVLMEAPGDDAAALLPLWERVAASFTPHTRRP
jgi:hypothetical protein